MKTLLSVVIMATGLTAGTAEGAGRNQTSVNGEIEFDVGGARIKVGGREDFNGRNIAVLNERIRRLEVAVQFLLENQGYYQEEVRTSVWECSVTTSFIGSFYARSDSKMSATALVLQKCAAVAGNFTCQSSSVVCEQIQ